MITVLAGGVGAARFLQGLTRILDTERLTIIATLGMTWRSMDFMFRQTLTH